MSAGMLGNPYIYPVGWITHSGHNICCLACLECHIFRAVAGQLVVAAYMLADAWSADDNTWPRHYMRLKDLSQPRLAEHYCRHLTHMKIRLKQKILTEACGQFTRIHKKSPLREEISSLFTRLDSINEE